MSYFFAFVLMRGLRGRPEALEQGSRALSSTGSPPHGEECFNPPRHQIAASQSARGQSSINSRVAAVIVPTKVRFSPILRRAMPGNWRWSKTHRTGMPMRVSHSTVNWNSSDRVACSTRPLKRTGIPTIASKASDSEARVRERTFLITAASLRVFECLLRRRSHVETVVTNATPAPEGIASSAGTVMPSCISSHRIAQLPIEGKL